MVLQPAFKESNVAWAVPASSFSYLILLNNADESVFLHCVGLPEVGNQLEPAECIKCSEDVLVDLTVGHYRLSQAWLVAGTDSAVGILTIN